MEELRDNRDAYMLTCTHIPSWLLRAGLVPIGG
jgi:hypothetical protein